MSDTELLIKEVETLPPGCIQEMIDFAGYLKQKYAQGQKDGIYNAVTIAALQEGDAMLKGEIPANRYHSLEEMFKALDE
jgi:hypothetical protein